MENGTAVIENGPSSGPDAKIEAADAGHSANGSGGAQKARKNSVSGGAGLDEGTAKSNSENTSGVPKPASKPSSDGDRKKAGEVVEKTGKQNAGTKEDKKSGGKDGGAKQSSGSNAKSKDGHNNSGNKNDSHGNKKGGSGGGKGPHGAGSGGSGSSPQDTTQARAGDAEQGSSEKKGNRDKGKSDGKGVKGGKSYDGQREHTSADGKGGKGKDRAPNGYDDAKGKGKGNSADGKGGKGKGDLDGKGKGKGHVPDDPAVASYGKPLQGGYHSQVMQNPHGYAQPGTQPYYNDGAHMGVGAGAPGTIHGDRGKGKGGKVISEGIGDYTFQIENTGKSKGKGGKNRKGGKDAAELVQGLKEPKYVYSVEELFDISELPKSNIKSTKIDWIIDKDNEESVVLQRAEKTHKPRIEKEKEKERERERREKGLQPSPDASPTGGDSDAADAAASLASASAAALTSASAAINVTPKRSAPSTGTPAKTPLPAQTPQNDNAVTDDRAQLDPNFCKALAGTWVVKYSNHFEHFISIQPNGDITSNKLPGPCYIRPCTDPPGWFHITPWFLEENHKEFLFPDSQGNLQIRHWIDGDFVCKAVGHQAAHFPEGEKANGASSAAAMMAGGIDAERARLEAAQKAAHARAQAAAAAAQQQLAHQQMQAQIAYNAQASEALRAKLNMTPQQLAHYHMQKNMHLQQQAHAAEIAKRVGMQQAQARAMASGAPPPHGAPPAQSGAELLRLLQGGGRPGANGAMPPPAHAPPKPVHPGAPLPNAGDALIASMARKMNQTPGAPPQLTPRQMEEQMRLQQGAPPGQGYPGQPPHK